jgi:hypothetical protein
LWEHRGPGDLPIGVVFVQGLEQPAAERGFNVIGGSEQMVQEGLYRNQEKFARKYTIKG